VGFDGAISRDNPLWGAPRIHGELLKLGFDIAESTVAKYMSQRHGPRSPGWQAFLRNHTAHIAGVDLFVVPTIGFEAFPWDEAPRYLIGDLREYVIASVVRFTIQQGSASCSAISRNTCSTSRPMSCSSCGSTASCPTGRTSTAGTPARAFMSTNVNQDLATVWLDR
jgi:hypothetical protein